MDFQSNKLGGVSAVFLLSGALHSLAQPMNTQGRFYREALTLEAPIGLRLGPFDVLPRITSQLYYDDNIILTSAESLDDFVTSIVPGATAVFGDQVDPYSKHFTLAYDAAATLYSQHSRYNSLDHYLTTRAVIPLSKFVFIGSYNFQHVTGPLVETGTRATRILHAASLSAEYEFSDKTSFETSLNHLITRYDASSRLINSEVTSMEGWMNYRLGPKINTSAGLIAGVTETSQSPQQTFQRPGLRVSYRFSDKLQAAAHVGAQFRQASGGNSSFSPVFSLSSIYRPLDSTRITLAAERREENSAVFAGVNYVSTRFSIGVIQRFLGSFFASLTATYDTSDYSSVSSTTFIGRNDTQLTFRPGLDYAITDTWTAGIFYQHRSNSSTREEYSFNNNRFGIQTSWRF